jgi:hypothetical protein
MVQILRVIALSSPSATAHSPAAAHSSAESAGHASRSHASEAAVALHARRTTVVITAEDTVLAGPTALLKARISEALLRRALPAINALWLAATASTITRKPAGHCAIAIRDAQPVFRIMHPR